MFLLREIEYIIYWNEDTWNIIYEVELESHIPGQPQSRMQHILENNISYVQSFGFNENF